MTTKYHYGKFPPQIEIDTELSDLRNQAMLELGRYDGLLASLPNSGVLLSPLLAQEAVLSSRIEGTQSTLTEFLEFEAHDGKQKIPPEKRNDNQEIFNYRHAMLMAIEDLKKLPLSERVLLNAHKELMQGVRGRNKSPGKYRKTPVWIGPDKTSNESARFIPIDAQHINSAMSKFSTYIHDDNRYDDVIKIAILHAEFESIHPFLDGNGRVGRLLIPLYLWQKKLLSTPSFYISEYFEKNKGTYYHLLEKVSANNDWATWIKFFIRGIIIQSQNNFHKAKKIIDYYNQLKDQIPKISKSIYGITALDFIFKNPIFFSTAFYKESDVPRAVAQRLLSVFAEEKILVCVKGQGRMPNWYAFDKLIEIADGKEN